MNGCKSYVAGYLCHLNLNHEELSRPLRLRQIKTWGKRSRRRRATQTDLRFSPGGETAAWGIRTPPEGLGYFRKCHAKPAALHAAGLSFGAFSGA
jgi:hypothetical protein